jgi:paraquat-inducible protein A
LSPASTFPATAAQAGLLSCPACSLVSRPPPARTDAWCPRCSARLHKRKPDSIARTWAFLIAAYVLYIPANVMPIMNTSSLFDAQRDTILSGVIYLWTTGSWATAALVFAASIVEPLLKLIALTYLLLSVQCGSIWKPHWRAQVYRVLSVVGRWSMLDIFVVTILVALVQIESVAEIKAGPGAFAFGAVVVLTMFAGFSFDPRLLWDPVESDHE